jgi:hypothetical protein
LLQPAICTGVAAWPGAASSTAAGCRVRRSWRTTADPTGLEVGIRFATVALAGEHLGELFVEDAFLDEGVDRCCLLLGGVELDQRIRPKLPELKLLRNLGRDVGVPGVDETADVVLVAGDDLVVQLASMERVVPRI